MKHQAINPEFTNEELYQGIAEDTQNLESKGVAGIIIPLENEEVPYERELIRMLIEIEEFVDAVCNSKDLGFKEIGTRIDQQINLSVQNWEVMPLGQEYYPRLDQFASTYNSVLAYSPKVMLFYEAFYSARPLGFSLPGDPQYAQRGPNESYIQGAFIFNALINYLRINIRSERYRSKVNARKQQSAEGYKSCFNYVEAIFKNVTTRLMAVRIDLGYHRGARDMIVLKTAQGHMEKLLNNRHKNSIFKHECGYIRKIEFTQTKGYHFHLVMFFDGAEVQVDTYKAFQIGEYWKTVITKGAGNYYNCNQSKNRYKRIGIGTVEHDDYNMRESLNYAIGYLCKSEQCLMIKSRESGAKSIVRGSMPKVRTTKAGRPRRSTNWPVVQPEQPVTAFNQLQPVATLDPNSSFAAVMEARFVEVIKTQDSHDDTNLMHFPLIT